VALDRHPAAAAVTTLPPLKITGQVFFPHGQAGGHAVENDGQPLAMGFAGREQAQRHAGTGAPSSAARITLSGAFLPVQISKDAAPWWSNIARPSGDRRLRKSKWRWSPRSQAGGGISAGVASRTDCARPTGR